MEVSLRRAPVDSYEADFGSGLVRSGKTVPGGVRGSTNESEYRNECGGVRARMWRG